MVFGQKLTWFVDETQKNVKFNENCITLTGILLSSVDIFNEEGENQVSTIETANK